VTHTVQGLQWHSKQHPLNYLLLSCSGYQNHIRCDGLILSHCGLSGGVRPKPWEKSCPGSMPCMPNRTVRMPSVGNSFH